MCLWTFASNLPNESAKGPGSTNCLAGALIPQQIVSVTHLAGEKTISGSESVGKPLCPRQDLDVIYKHMSVSPNYFCTYWALHTNFSITAVFLSHHITIVMKNI
jgi:hypothetical protein